jgi:hypothetical protein
VKRGEKRREEGEKVKKQESSEVRKGVKTSERRREGVGNESKEKRID